MPAHPSGMNTPAKPTPKPSLSKCQVCHPVTAKRKAKNAVVVVCLEHAVVEQVAA